MSKLRFIIPNLFTSANLFLGVTGIVLTFHQGLTEAFYCVLLAAGFDFLDGFTARILKAQSPIGKELDSLADVVTFGVLPGVMLFHYISISQGNYYTPIYERPLQELLVSFVAFLVPVFSALRLAIFNVDEKQGRVFYGLPTPANALLISSLGFIMEIQFGLNYYQPIADDQLPVLLGLYYWDYFDFYTVLGFYETWVHVTLAVVMSVLLVARIPLFSLKLKSLKWSENKVLYSYLIALGVLLILNFVPYWISIGKLHQYWPGIDFVFIPLSILLYIVISVIGYPNLKQHEV